MNQTGVTLFSIPRTVGEAYGRNGWIFLVMHFAIASFNIFLIFLVYKYGKGRSIFKIIEDVLPKFLYIPIYFFLIGVWCLIAILVCRDYVILLQIVSFQTTKAFPFIFIILGTAYLFIIKGIYNISKITTIIFFLTI